MEHWEIVANKQYVIDSTGEELFENMCAYFNWCDNNPIESEKVVTSGKMVGTTIKSKARRPYTIKGMCLHCGITQTYLKDLQQMKDKSSDYWIAVERGLAIIHTQNVENAIIGEFNPIFTAKVLNMESDDTPVSAVRVEIISGTPELANSESEVLEKMEYEKWKLEKSKEQFPER